jgi:hypothetical protein
MRKIRKKSRELKGKDGIKALSRKVKGKKKAIKTFCL